MAMSENFANMDNDVTNTTYTVVSQMPDHNNGSTNIADIPDLKYRYWTTLLGLFVLATLFGNILVVIAVKQFKHLRSVTNYLIVSLAIADITVGALVMPLAVYVEVMGGQFLLPVLACDVWIALDVLACTASILMMTAISTDRYIAVIHPISYTNHFKRSTLYPVAMISLCWIFSIAISLPIVLGVNNTANRPEHYCGFHNPYFSMISSIFSFVIPMISMTILYIIILKAIQRRANAKREKVVKTKSSILHQGSGQSTSSSSGENDKRKGSEGASDESLEDDRKGSHAKKIGDCIDYSESLLNGDQQVRNGMDSTATEFMHKKNFNETSSLICDKAAKYEKTFDGEENNNNNNNNNNNSNQPHHEIVTVLHEEPICVSYNKPKIVKQSSTGLLKRKEKAVDRKEKRAIITLIVVLIIFVFCWLPFFVVNNMLVICKHMEFHLEMSACPEIPNILMGCIVWLGYINSMLNPIIYAVLNLDFRKGFRRILKCDMKKRRSSY